MKDSIEVITLGPKDKIFVMFRGDATKKRMSQIIDRMEGFLKSKERVLTIKNMDICVIKQ